MAGMSSYVATPKKRLSAAFVDLLLIGLAAVLVYALGDAIGYQTDYGALVAIAYFGYHAPDGGGLHIPLHRRECATAAAAPGAGSSDVQRHRW